MCSKYNPTSGLTEKETAEYFIKQAKEKFGENTFDYSLVKEIKLKKSNVEIICKKHGAINTSMYKHIDSSTGCPNCGLEMCRKSKRLTFSEFIVRIQKVNAENTYRIMSTRFVSNRIQNEFVYTQDEFGICKVNVGVLLRGGKPSIKTAIFPLLYEINKFRRVHGFKYNYSKVSYIGALKKVEFVCRIHGSFFHTPNWHLSGMGCPNCYEDRRGISLRSTTSKFIKKSIERWGYNKKVYDKVIYTHAKEKVLILCERHLEYYCITPNDHLTGYGCPRCGLETGGYTKEAYLLRANNKDNLIYIIKCWNESEEFYKIGRTYKGINKRFRSAEEMPYNFEVIYEYRCSAECVFDTEINLHYKYKDSRYSPKIYFAGYTECFNTELPIQEIIEELK